jgi:hypothetical protein
MAVDDRLEELSAGQLRSAGGKERGSCQLMALPRGAPQASRGFLATLVADITRAPS